MFKILSCATYLDRKARCRIFAGLLTIVPVPALRGDRGQCVIQVVIQELPPLHDHVREPVVLRHGVRADDAGRHKPCARHRVAVVLDRLLPSHRHAEAVLVHGLEDASEARQRRPPHGVLQVVARAVDGAILAVEAHVGAVDVEAVNHAAGQVGHEGEMRRTQELLVGEVGGEVETHAGLDVFTNVGQGSLVDVGRASDAASLGVGEARLSEQLLVRSDDARRVCEELVDGVVDGLVDGGAGFSERDADELVSGAHHHDVFDRQAALSSDRSVHVGR